MLYLFNNVVHIGKGLQACCLMTIRNIERAQTNVRCTCGMHAVVMHLYRVGVIKMELAQQIRADFEEAFQGPNAKVILLCI
jgi:hypothetical protein